MDTSTSPEGIAAGSTGTETASSGKSTTPRSAVVTVLGSKSLEQVCAEQGIDSQRLKELLEHEPAIDAARVVDLHRRITAGQYTADAERIVDKLLDLEKLL